MSVKQSGSDNQQRLNAVPLEDISDYLGREDALAILGVKRETLYTYVSRGLIRSIQLPGTNARQFSRDDISQLRLRHRIREGSASPGEGSMRWGTPVVESMITQISERGPVYREHSAIELARSGLSFESVSEFLWSASLPSKHANWPAVAQLSSKLDFLKSFDRSNNILQIFSHAVIALTRETEDVAADRGAEKFVCARQLMVALTRCCGWLSADQSFDDVEMQERTARKVARLLGIATTDETISALDTALILCADFELAPGTFAARIAASAGADMSACIVAGICAHSGKFAGGGIIQTESLLFDNLTGENRKTRLNLARDYGDRLFGFNHPLFPKGDPRARELISSAKRFAKNDYELHAAFEFLHEAETQYDLKPGIGIALLLLCRALVMPRQSALAIWTLGRTAGLIAHIIEQRSLRYKIRPRAHYIGSKGMLRDTPLNSDKYKK
ncbi:MAG: citrate/2-methylcitrate synthase [Burkholderiaceae bacterium]|nr:citrate/2-methylcitrate synthase [Burkholderiaceae bacterium]